MTEKNFIKTILTHKPEMANEFIRRMKGTKRSTTELACLFAQLAHESANFERLEENTKYTEDRAREIWGSRVPENLHWGGGAQGEVRKELFDAVYGGRMGNNTTGDGSLFTGRGLIQLTGRNNFSLFVTDSFAKWDGDDAAEAGVIIFNEDPIGFSVLSALWYWDKHVQYPTIIKDKQNQTIEDIVKVVTKRINGGYIGLSHRTDLTKEYLQLWSN